MKVGHVGVLVNMCLKSFTLLTLCDTAFIAAQVLSGF